MKQIKRISVVADMPLYRRIADAAKADKRARGNWVLIACEEKLARLETERNRIEPVTEKGSAA